MDNNTPRARKADLVLQEIDGEVLIYDLKADKAFCLNKTSALVWQACDGKRTIAEISDVLRQQLNSRVSDDVVWLALDQLSRESLMESVPATHPVTNGLTRRDAVKRIGLASAIALPIVTSLIAPMAIHANSLCVVGGTCTCSANGTIGVICATSVPCADTNCQCQRINNGGGANGTCVA